MKRILAISLIVCLMLSLSVSAAAAGEQQHDYSTTANSGIRHEVCTSLLGTSADEYYTGGYTYQELSTQTGDELLSTLRTLMTSTHKKKSDYNDCRDMAVKTDCENGDGTSISLLYTSYSATWDDWCNNRTGGWNREHVWPKSNGGFEQSQVPGCDLHHVRPADQTVNSTRGNKKYGEADGGKTVTGAAYTGSAVGGAYLGSYFEPLDNVKGDVARICLYVYVRYGGEYSKCSSITNTFQSVDVLLEWCALDPVDTWEMGRNEVVGAYQGNRNVFIDYPELAWLLFDEDIPTDMTTPSGEAGNGTASPCKHTVTTIRDAYDATCTESGYTGDTYCSDCGKKLSSGSSISAAGHTNSNGDAACDTCGASVSCGHGETERRNVTNATCGAAGYTGDLYCVYCDTRISSGETTPATGEHSLTDGVCTVCGYTDQVEDPTDPSEPTTDPTEPSEPTTDPTEPSEPTTDPTDPSGGLATDPTEPSATQPPETQTPSTQTTEPGEHTENEPDYQWLVYVVIGVGAVVCVGVILIQNKKHRE